MKYKVAPLAGIIFGILFAGIVRIAVNDSNPGVRVLQNLTFLLSLALTLAILRRAFSWRENLRDTLKALVLILAAVVILSFVTLVLIEYPVMQAIGTFLGGLIKSVGWYPSGADAWFPLAIAFWCFSVAFLAVAAVMIAAVVVRLRRP